MAANTTSSTQGLTSSSVAIPSGTTSSISSSFPVTTPSTSSIASQSTSTSFVSISPSSTVTVPASTSSASVAVVSSTTYVPPTSEVSSGSVAIVTITSTQAPVTVTPANTQSISTASSASATPSILSQAGSKSSSSGIGTSGKIAIAVIIPIIVVAALFALGIFLWRKRRERQTAEEQRKDEMAEYGFNPNNDPTLVPVGAAYTDGGSEADDGYRGWGTTTSNTRKASTGPGSNGKGPTVTYSDTMSQPGNFGYQSSPTGHASEHWSGDPLVGHPESIDGVGALGGVAAGAGAAGLMSRNNRTSQSGVQRGPSNASSSYSHNAHSEASSDGQAIVNYYQDEVPYNIYNDVAPSHGPYGDGTYGASGPDQPVIRDVQARRNTRIERVPTFPQTQGGISQNF